MDHQSPSFWLGAASALLMGLSKTGLPGANLPSVLVMTEAFPHDARLSVGAIVPVILVGDVIAVYWYRRHADWPSLWRLFPWVAAGMLPGIVVLAKIQGNGLRPVLGWLILALLAWEGVRRGLGYHRLPHSRWFVGLMGLVTGFGTIVGNAAGPMMAIYLVSAGLRKEAFIGTSAWFFFVVNLSKLPVMAALGMITSETLRFGATVSPAVPLGAAAGVWLLTIIPQKPFDVFALTLAGLAALRLVVVA
jgi:uncharacterized protein